MEGDPLVMVWSQPLPGESEAHWRERRWDWNGRGSRWKPPTHGKRKKRREKRWLKKRLRK